MAYKLLNSINNLIGEDNIFSVDAYNKALNRVGKKPLAYQYSYDKTRKLLSGLNNQTKTIMIIILSEEYGHSYKLWSRIFSIQIQTFMLNKKLLEESEFYNTYISVSRPMTLLLYSDYIIK